MFDMFGVSFYLIFKKETQMITPIVIAHRVKFVYRLSYRGVCLSILAQLHYLIVEKGNITKYDPKQKLIWTVGTLVTLPSKYHTIYFFTLKYRPTLHLTPYLNPHCL